MSVNMPHQTCFFSGPNELLFCHHKLYSWVKVRNFQNPELFKNKILKLAVCLQISTISSFSGQLSLDKLNINLRSL